MMGDFDTIAKNAARDMIRHVGDDVTYRGSVGVIPTKAVIDPNTEIIGGEIEAGDTQWICILLVEDVSSPQRGDEVVDKDGIVWTLQHRNVDSDGWIDEWAVTKR